MEDQETEKSKDHVEMTFDRIRLFLGGMMLSNLITVIIWPQLNNSAALWVIMLYVGMVLMATFWDDV